MRVDHLAFGITAGLACASCNTIVPALTQGAAVLLSDVNERRSRTSFASSTPGNCHPVASVFTYNGETVPSYGQACQQPDGSWMVIASSDPEGLARAVEARPVLRPRASAFGPGLHPYDDPWCTMGRPGLRVRWHRLRGAVRRGFAFRHRRSGDRCSPNAACA